MYEYGMAERQHTIAPLQPEHAESVGDILAQAFQNEPNFTYMLPDDEQRRDVLAWFFTVAVKAGQLYGEVHSTPDLKGAAVWLSPGNALGFFEMLRTGLIQMPFKLGWSAFMRSMRLNNEIATVQERLVGDQRWYLMVLGVAPSAQGQGLGGALMEPILTRADSEGLPCYLETFNEQRLSFYEKYDFRVADEGVIPGGGPHYWAMVR